MVNSKIPIEIHQKIISRLASEPSDTKLSKEFGVHRKTIWRLRQPLKGKVNEASVQTTEMTSLSPKIEDSPAIEALLPEVEAVTSAEVLPLKVENLEVKELPIIEKAPSKVEATPFVESLPFHTPSSVEENKVQEKSSLTVELSKDQGGVFSAVLSTYFAVQLFRYETYRDIVQEILIAANSEDMLFRKIQVLDTPSIGATTFVRFRSDVKDAHALVKLLKKRAFIVQISNSFMVQFPDGRLGKCPAALMCATAKTGFGQTFVGTRIKRWEKQFTVPNVNPSLV